MGGDQADRIASILGYNGHTRVDAQGFSGGIWVYWKPELVSIDPIIKSNQYITMTISRRGEEPWYFTLVYASPDPTKHNDLWQELSDFASQNNKPWLLAGDFNETRFGWERNSSCNERTRRTERFNHWVEDNQLIEVEFSGSPHTWAWGNSMATRRSARLDRALCNSEWGLFFDKARVKHFPAIQSDHCPLLISPNGFAPLETLYRPFCFQAAWLSHENFNEFLCDKWRTDIPLMNLLKSFSSDLQQWNNTGCSDSFSKWEGLGLLKLEAKLRKELDSVLNQEEMLWYQKARVDWLQHGDRNTTFFHLSMVVRRWRNNIVAIKDTDGQWLFDQSQVKYQVVSYCAQLYTDDGDEGTYNIPSGVCTAFSNSQWESLNRPYTNCDIEFVVKNMGSLKAPGPDGFQALFYQKNWDTVAQNVYDLAKNVLEGKGTPDLLNETYLVLLPKVDSPDSASQFRPIGLCNVAYKIITKAIVNRIKPLLPKIIANTQSSFFPGRQITDNIVIMQEVLHTMKRKKGGKGYMTIKIDFEKAYDRLKWAFIRNTLMEMNFPIRMIEVIMECITTPSMNILWNGEKTDAFYPTRGIRQGDPLSPYLFVLCMERLNQVIEESIVANRWKPIYASRGGPLLSNLFFVDDLILFAEASIEQAEIVRDCLDRFCVASGQKVSLPKSRVFFSQNVHKDAQKGISEALGMDVTEDLGFYLGMPTLTNTVTKQTYAYLCEKIDRRLSGWKSKYLSLAGRVTLAKSAITTMANYSMQSAKIPRTVCDKIDQKSRRFIWGGNEEKNRIHLLSWETLQIPKEKGGLGIRSARQSNSAFLAKLGWRVLNEPNALWSRVLRHKYCSGQCDIDMFVPTSSMSNVWRGITENASLLKKGSAVAIGNGGRTLFWDHVWATDGPLRDVAIDQIPEDIDGAIVAELWDDDSGWKWDKIVDLLPIAALKRIAAHKVIQDPELEDIRYWKGGKAGEFSVKDAMRLIKDDSMKLRHLTDDPRCKRCDLNTDETLLHLFRDCPAAREAWASVGSAENYPSFFSGDLSSWLVRNLKGEELIHSEKWPTCFAITLWWIWKWRNGELFGNPYETPSDVGVFIRSQTDSTWEALTGTTQSPKNPGSSKFKQETLIKWLAPPMDWFTLNTDGAAKGNPGYAGGGGIIRDCQGNFMQCFTTNFGICSAFRAELLAAEIGLQMASKMGLNKLVLQMDNKAGIEALSKGVVQGGEYTRILTACHRLITFFN
ncbi:uncharacterized protein LOC110693390 [Chenopodium quinoa]|uniref:uncharacterized protein LOC110693390 n=1 Tax=Chenopodium quinoa TaxID=63459 RepID=UPI000B771D4F|nr:uncharacterized protein LOC110693390 [Chenopodium quinoa]